MRKFHFIGYVLFLLSHSISSAMPAKVPFAVPEKYTALLPALPETVDYNFHIKPILADRCFKCHGPDANQRMVNLRLDLPEGAYGSLLLAPGAAVKPHHPEESVLLHRVLSDDPERIMPPVGTGLELSDTEKALLLKWIAQGGEYKPHWSLIPLSQSPVTNAPVSTTIDDFIQRRLDEHELAFSPEADKETLLRRVSFDLTGLPPLVEEIDAFLSDNSDNAYERIVDRLLASPHYGERMAVDWLDLSRYADTYGYQADFYRPTWRWRDWVIQAFNENMPYDQFITWQLAGDLLPNAKTEQILATGFNRNHSQNAEGGIINEEYRVEYAADRTDTFGKAFLGISLECARCHDHKYDPITQKEYYQVFSFFNNVDEAGQITWSNIDLPAPTMLLLTDEAKKKAAELDEEIQKTERRLGDLPAQKKSEFEAWINKIKTDGDSVLCLPKPIALYPLDEWSNRLIPNAVGDATCQVVDPISMQITDVTQTVIEGKKGKAVQLDGDNKLDFPKIGRFTRSEPFSIGMWVKIPGDLTQGVIFHGNRGEIIYSFKGYQVSIENNHFDIRLAHSFPYNSIHLVSNDLVPKEQWIHLMLTYDGSSKAGGVHFYVDGESQPMETKRDNLYKEIVFVKEGIATNLRVGARWRSKGFTNGCVDEITVYNQALSPLAVGQAGLGKSLLETLHSGDNGLSEKQIGVWEDYYYSHVDFEAQRLRQELRKLRAERNKLNEEAEEVMVMAEMPKPRPAYLLLRGAYDAPGEEVHPGTPQNIFPFSRDLPTNRIGLAQWLTHPDNPLPARVLANRLWQQFFGRGIVETTENMGSQGSLPTHPELLDWLAARIIAGGWDVKAMQKRIVMSRAYRQSSNADTVLLQKDPNNLWLARGPRQRLPAEMLRDNALAASGLLARKLGGPSVKPYQPEGVWSFGSTQNYQQDKGENLYRRSLYTFWKRTIPPPTLNLFDAPFRSNCTVRRQATNTPLQSLALLNDPQFIEAARVLAVSALIDAPDEVPLQIQAAFRRIASRRATEEELNVLSELFQKQKTAFDEQPESREGWLTTGEYKNPRVLNTSELAALTVTVSAIMNSDACVVKR